MTTRPDEDQPDVAATFRLDGKVAIVTGASSGIGARAAKVYNSLGATVALAARRLDRLQLLADQLDNAAAFTCDVGQTGASEELVASVLGRFERVDVVFAAAGITANTPAFRETPAQFNEVAAVNLLGSFELARAAAVDMRQRGAGGSIIFVSSFVAFRSLAAGPAAGYVASKTGLIGLAHELAMQWARYAIRVNVICPGFYPSDMTPSPPSDEFGQWVRSNVPLGRIASAHELDGAIAFLAGPASTYMTGQPLVVDGGASL